MNQGVDTEGHRLEIEISTERGPWEDNIKLRHTIRSQLEVEWSCKGEEEDTLHQGKGKDTNRLVKGKLKEQIDVRDGEGEKRGKE